MLQSTRYIPAWKNKGSLLYFIGNYGEALKSFDIALDIDPKDVSAWCGKGIVLHLLNMDREAVKCFDEAIKIDPESIRALVGKGNSLNQSGNHSEAIECYDRSIAIDSREAGFEGAWTKKGDVLSYLAKYDEAVDCYDKAIETYSQDYEAWEGKRDAFRHLKRNTDADECEKKLIECYDEILAVNPKSVSTWKEEGDIFLKAGRYEKAIECYDNALRISMYYADIWENKGAAMDKLGRQEEAAQYYSVAKTIRSMPSQELPHISEEGFMMETQTFVNEPLGSLGQDGIKFYKISNYREISSSSYDFMKRYYELDNQSDPLLERNGGHTYLTTQAGGFYMPLNSSNGFDCSQKAALMEYYLERCGIRAKIAYSYNFTLEGNRSKHAWIVIDLPGGPYYVDVMRHQAEHNKLMLIAPEDNDYTTYSKFENLYDNIYDLIKDSLDNPDDANKKILFNEFNWWDSDIFMRDRNSAYIL